MKELYVKIKELEKEYLTKGKELTIEEISQELKLSKEEIVMALESANPVDSLENATYRDTKSDKTISILEKVSNQKDEATLISNKLTIEKLINDLNKKDKEVILLRFYSQKTQMQVAKILGITQVQVSRIERKVLSKMKEELVS